MISVHLGRRWTRTRMQSQLSVDTWRWRRSGGSWKRRLLMGRLCHGSRKPTDLCQPGVQLAPTPSKGLLTDRRCDEAVTGASEYRGIASSRHAVGHCLRAAILIYGHDSYPTTEGTSAGRRRGEWRVGARGVGVPGALIGP